MPNLSSSLPFHPEVPIAPSSTVRSLVLVGGLTGGCTKDGGRFDDTDTPASQPHIRGGDDAATAMTKVVVSRRIGEFKER